MSERKTRGRQRIPIQLIQNKDDLLVSFSKRRLGVFKKAGELSTLCAVDVGAILFSPSGIPHAFFTPDFDSVVHGCRNSGQGGAAEGSPRTRIRRLNKRLDEVIEQQEREERREKLLDAAVGAAEMGWWEVPVESLNADQVKEQIEWFQTLKAQIKSRAQELKNGGGSSVAAAASPPRDGDGTGECFFAPPPLHDGNQCILPPPPPHFDVGGGGSSQLTADQYLFAPPPPPPFDTAQYCYPPPSLNLFGGGGIGRVSQQYFCPPSPLRGGIDPFLAAAQGYGDVGPSRREAK